MNASLSRSGSGPGDDAPTFRILDGDWWESYFCYRYT